MTPQKRLFDLGVALLLSVILVVPFCCVIVVLLCVQGRPIFYVSDRMRAPGQPFRLVKLRTMSAAMVDSGVSGGDKASRVTKAGQVLRALRIDEIPQLWNVLRGDMSLVGPRPPLPSYVERFPEVYAQVLRSRPGITGLATLVFHRHEERLLKACKTAAETDHVYTTRCIPRKAALDLVYQRNQTLWLDLMLILRTLGGVLSR